MTTVMVIMVSNLDLCYESFGHTAYGSLHVDGIGIGEHVEVAIIFRDGLSAMSLVRSLFEPQKSVWLSMSFDVETGKNYRVFCCCFVRPRRIPKQASIMAGSLKCTGHVDFLVACFWMIVQHQV